MFSLFFRDDRLDLLHRLVELALEEDGRDLTSEALFEPVQQVQTIITEKKGKHAGFLAGREFGLAVD